MRILLLIPPMTQLNTPYPATAYLKGFLNKINLPGVEVFQADPAIELVTMLFSKRGLKEIRDGLEKVDLDQAHASVQFFLKNYKSYMSTVEPAIRFLQGKDPSLALRIAGREFLPEGPRFQVIESEGEGEAMDSDSLTWAFGSLGVQDRARYLASLYLDDLADVIHYGIDSKFELSRYGEKLAASAPTFDPLCEALEGSPSCVDVFLDEISERLIQQVRPDVVGLTVPFPGNVYGALRIGRKIKEMRPEISIVLGGGYVNTELRELEEPRVFDYVDFVTLDDGEKPFQCIIEHLMGRRNKSELLRTFIREEEKVILRTSPGIHDVPHRECGTPSYKGLPLDQYLSVFEMLNPMHRIWSDGRWNKLTLAHGCYWRKCNFCDISLDYIGRYDPASADLLVDRIETIMAETGQSGFHFVDEAAPPAVLRALAERLIQRNCAITWWGNIRFEKTFTPELTALLAKSGCVAVSGGLEVASDRLLKFMQKGVSVEQVARVARAFSDSGVMVHAYLMYGFPTQTVQETVDSLERVRQLFAWGCIQSGYWHRFSATVHSPIGQNPEKFGIRLLSTSNEDSSETGRKAPQFARNDLPFEDPTDCDHDFLGKGLRRALYHFMHGAGLDRDVREWFTETEGGQSQDHDRSFQQKRGTQKPGLRIRRTTVSSDWAENALLGRKV